MKKIGLFYGSTTGRTKKVAELIKKEFGATSVELFDIKHVSPTDILKYENLIFGTSAWGIGDMQDDWETFIDDMAELDLSGKKIALFGLGDQTEYPGSFADGMGTLYCRMPDKNNIVGFTSTDGYEYYFSSAEKDGKFVGLALDEDNQQKLTPDRVRKWVAQLKKELQQKKVPARGLFFIAMMTCYSSGWMASTGQTSAQEPQSVQISGSIT